MSLEIWETIFIILVIVGIWNVVLLILGSVKLTINKILSVFKRGEKDEFDD